MFVRLFKWSTLCQWKNKTSDVKKMYELYLPGFQVDDPETWENRLFVEASTEQSQRVFERIAYLMGSTDYSEIETEQSPDIIIR